MDDHGIASVSVVVTTYYRNGWLRDAVESALARAAYHAPEDRPRYLGECLATALLGRPGRRPFDEWRS